VRFLPTGCKFAKDLIVDAVLSGDELGKRGLGCHLARRSRSVSANNGGATALVKSGPGTLIFSGGSANTYSGPTYVNAGSLEITGASTGILGTGALDLGAGLSSANAELYFAEGGSVTYSNPVNVGGGPGGTVQIYANSGVPSFSGLLTLNNSLLVDNNNSAGSTISFSGGIDRPPRP
jgi:autotransporter-associated beta strand protein